MSAEPRTSRRALLLGALAVPLAGCRPRRSRGAASKGPAVDPDADALRQAIGDEEALLLTLRQLADLGDVRDVEQGVHADHVIALRRALLESGARPVGATASPSADAVPARRRALLRAFAQQRSASARRLRGLALTAADGGIAALLASIAASHSAPAAGAGATLSGSQS